MFIISARTILDMTLSVLYVYDVYQYRFLSDQTLCLNKVIAGQSFAKNAWKMSDIRL